MYPFNLEGAIAGEKLVTRGGREATDFHFDDKYGDCQPYWATMGFDKRCYSEDGVWCISGREDELDLFMAQPSSNVPYNITDYKALIQDDVTVKSNPVIRFYPLTTEKKAVLFDFIVNDLFVNSSDVNADVERLFSSSGTEFVNRLIAEYTKHKGEK